MDGDVLVGFDALVDFGFGSWVMFILCMRFQRSARVRRAGCTCRGSQSTRRVRWPCRCGAGVVVLVELFFEGAQALQGEDFFLDVLGFLVVDLGVDDAVEELEGFICLVDALHGEEVGEARAGVPAVHAADEEFLGRMGGGVHHEVDELMECIL